MFRRSNAPVAAEGRLTVIRIMDRLNVGGPAIHAVLTTKGLDAEKFRTVLVIGAVEAGEGDMGYLLAEHGVTDVVSIPSLGRELRPFADLKTLWQLIAVLRRERPHIVHTHKAKAGALGRLAAVLCRVPVRVHTFHGHVLSGYFGPAKTRIFTEIERLLARASACLVTPSEAVAQELAFVHKVALRNKFQVIPLGFDLSPFVTCSQYRGRLRAELGVGPFTKLIGIVGRMVPVKDHATFIAAAALLAKQRADVDFVFVGGGSSEEEQKIHGAIEAHELSKRTHILGWRKDLPLIYADLDVVALSSINEGTPVSLIEAMAAGVPVVSTNVGGVSDVLANGARGALVPPRDPAAMAAALFDLLSDGAKERSAKVRDEIVATYGISRLCKELGELYLRLVGAQ